MSVEINFNANSLMKKGYPQIRKLGAVSPYGESTPFVFNNRLYRLELKDPSHGLHRNADISAIIRDRETGEILSSFAQECYYHSLYQENGKVYVLGTLSEKPAPCGSTIMIYESADLINWSGRKLLENPGWQYYNTSLTKSPDGYVLCLEAGAPREYVGDHPFTCFFATSKDMIHWEFIDYDKCYCKDRYNGGPWLRYSNGYYYLISVTELPCYRFTNYIYRTKDFDTWEVGKYNPLLIANEDDRKISPYAYDLSPELIKQIRTGFNSNNSDIDMCDYNGKTLISYNTGNQLGFYYMAEAEYDGTVDEFLEAFFE